MAPPPASSPPLPILSAPAPPDNSRRFLKQKRPFPEAGCRPASRTVATGENPKGTAERSGGWCLTCVGGGKWPYCATTGAAVSASIPRPIPTVRETLPACPPLSTASRGTPGPTVGRGPPPPREPPVRRPRPGPPSGPPGSCPRCARGLWPGARQPPLTPPSAAAEPLTGFPASLLPSGPTCPPAGRALIRLEFRTSFSPARLFGTHRVTQVLVVSLGE